jgi:hypothetical protein
MSQEADIPLVVVMVLLSDQLKPAVGVVMILGPEWS